MSLKNTEIQDTIIPIPNVNMNKHANIYGNNIYHALILAGYSPNPTYDSRIIAIHGINVNKKFIPTNKHFAIGKMYFGIYTLFISVKLYTTEVIALDEASLK